MLKNCCQAYLPINAAESKSATVGATQAGISRIRYEALLVQRVGEIWGEFRHPVLLTAVPPAIAGGP